MTDPSSSEARACIEAYFEELNARFEEGFNPAITVSAEPEGLKPPNGLFALARLGDTPVGCGGVKIGSDGIGEIKRMWVAPTRAVPV
ncbi:MAG: hypothetical protein LC114_15590 [Bryobacterales bacterium]|nr:hypothetical protein [Bryobacterales bacterium]